MTEEDRQNAEEADKIATMIRPMLAGENPIVQSAVLAELTALWLAGQVMRGDPLQTRRRRKALLDGHVALIRQLVPVMYEMEIKPKIMADTH